MRSLLKTVLGAALGLALGLSICLIAGESPFKVLMVLYKSGFGTLYDFGMTLFYTAPLILTGLAVAIPFKAGLFNIGAEGQLTMGAVAASAAGVIGGRLGITQPFLAISLAVILAFVAGGIWGWFSGFLKAKRGSHEVITTIMLNFISAGVASYYALYLLKDPDSSQAETVLLPEIYHLKSLAIFNGAPMGYYFLALIVLVIAVQAWLRHSVWGYELKAVGENETAAELYGISKSKIWMSSFFVAGGFAGLVGVTEVLGNAHRFKPGFSADYGFVGIAVALVARGNILGILPAALLFGVLQKGSGSLDLETDKITRDLSYVIQGLIILGVASEGLWSFIDRYLIKHRRNRDRKNGGKKMLAQLLDAWILPVLRVSTPLIFAAMGGLWCERSGVIQIGLEGFILVGSFFGAVAALHFSNPYLGFLFAGIAGMGLSALYGVVVLKYRANQIVAATAINMLALGIPPFLSKIWFDSTGSTPPIPTEAQFHIAPILIMFGVVALSHFIFYYGKFGLRLRFAGEHPYALKSAGVSVKVKRWQGVLLSGFLAGLGGGTLSIYLSSSFIRNMSAGRGFIALAAIILGKWRPIPTACACLLFGITEAVQIRLQGVILWGTEPVPVQWIQILPYLITLIVLAGIVGRSYAPQALGTFDE